jgi:hypothetical protein
MPDYITVGKLSRLLDKDSLNMVISCVDNNATRNANLRCLDEFEGNFVFITPGNDLDFGQVQGYGKLEGSIIGCDPRTYTEGIADPKDVEPYKGGCMTMGESSPQLIGANLMAATSTFMVIENWLDGEGFLHELSFSLRDFRISR